MYFMQESAKLTEVRHLIRFFAGTLIWYLTHTHTHPHSHPHTPPPHTHTHTEDLENICQRIKLTLIFRALFCSEGEGKDKITPPPLPLPPLV